MKTQKILWGLALILVLAVLTSWLLWFLSPKKPISILIVDKSVMDEKRTEHQALFYAMNQARFVKMNGHKYDIEQDYYGFIPLKPYKDKNYELRRIRLSEVDTLADYYDVVYYADTYGVYFNDWFSGVKRQSKAQQIIGGLTQNDYLLIRTMLDKGKTVIAEHNFLSYSTDPLVRMKVEELFSIRQTGWVGCCFQKLDSTNKLIPPWIFEAHHRFSGKAWNYKGKGIILTKGSAVVLVLSEGIELETAEPLVTVEKNFANNWNLPEQVAYQGWFEIAKADSGFENLASFRFQLSDSGRVALRTFGVPDEFPAIVKSGSKHNFWYLAGDFSDASLPYKTFRFKGALKLFPGSSNDFARNLYFPFINRLLEQSKSEN